LAAGIYNWTYVAIVVAGFAVYLFLTGIRKENNILRRGHSSQGSSVNSRFVSGVSVAKQISKKMRGRKIGTAYVWVLCVGALIAAWDAMRSFLPGLGNLASGGGIASRLLGIVLMLVGAEDVIRYFLMGRVKSWLLGGIGWALLGFSFLIITFCDNSFIVAGLCVGAFVSFIIAIQRQLVVLREAIQEMK
jgi:hypothetical protein